MVNLGDTAHIKLLLIVIASPELEKYHCIYAAKKTKTIDQTQEEKSLNISKPIQFVNTHDYENDDKQILIIIS